MEKTSKTLWDKVWQDIVEFAPKAISFNAPKDDEGWKIYSEEIDEEHRREADLLDEFSEPEIWEMING